MEDLKFKIVPCYAPSGDSKLPNGDFDDFQEKSIIRLLELYIRQFSGPIPKGLKIEPQMESDIDCENFFVVDVYYGYRDKVPVMFVWLDHDL